VDAVYSQQVRLSKYAPCAALIEIRFAKWKRDAENWYQQDSAMFEGLFNSVHANIVRMRFRPISRIRVIANPVSVQAKGDDRPSLSGTLIREADRHQLSMRENSWLAGTM
jgi:hypothetical protein